MKNLEKEEAVVDHVKPSNVVTNVALLKQFNLEVHNKQDVEFDTEFELCSTGERMLTVRMSIYYIRIFLPIKIHAVRMTVFYLQGFTTYFDVEFSHCHLPVQFSTSPFSPPTHWGQTNFLLRKNYILGQGVVILGIFRMNRNKLSERDLDFQIGFIVKV